MDEKFQNLILLLKTEQENGIITERYIREIRIR